ncbi:MAG: 4-(cytidine 5'-diphospho)-2-C-methyl-D-erythritol kinase [Candidatus Aminicenantes bacterium]|nr:4-(cytidine 5'-diphospho)-2-C-methyl-D-erythritol kinase [Candidatus Aminicenantes bacterium]
MQVKSFAKVNLGLEILGKRPDGYHDIRTLFQTVNLYDILEFEILPEDKILLHGNDRSISWGEDNLMFKASSLLKKETGVLKGVRIRVEKNIPAGMGLGGGSSNAAVSLLSLNTLWNLGLNRNDLLKWAKKLGADVPFFLYGGFCLGLERGDRILEKEDLDDVFFLLALPDFSVSTAHVYRSLPMSLTSGDKGSKINEFLTNFDFGLLENRLEKTVFRLYPQLKAIKRLIQVQEPELLLVTGTGSAIVGLFRKKDEAENAGKAIEKKFPYRVVKSISRSEYWKGVTIGV